MLWTVVCYLVLLLLLRELFKPVPAPINGIYRQPGRWYHLKRIIFLFMFKLRQWKKRKEKTLQEGNSGYGASVSDPEEMEDNPPLMDNPFAIDSVYFGGFNKDGVYLAARVARRHGRHSEVWLYLRIPGVGDFHHPVHPDTLVSNVTPRTLTAGGLRIEMLEPMIKWRISFNGLLRKGVCKELGREESTLVCTKFSFIWKAMTDPFNFDTNINPRALADAMAREKWTRDFFNRLQRDHQTHYEQWGELSGGSECCPVYIDHQTHYEQWGELSGGSECCPVYIDHQTHYEQWGELSGGSECCHVYIDHQTHYEQWGELSGRIQVEGREEQFFRLKAVRDHSYGTCHRNVNSCVLNADISSSLKVV
ncbi:uncharacterized protein LOC134281343 [Saccostrea cucullata]|uniref:uncharacterized protein LOC134281343 n=1 Tax=Saccostrea cuccullata TaxID=36930 RepID=UPI002ED38695